ncbi:CGNR zinc finger domain-containing protein [Paenibacillus swuensis]|uniref:CGNR zinc finger domain-containing protein n=1 Tax=Paenibacillus swuensis TaxID=1178515 RepID=UPI0008394FC4|nr:CGNR zinc finger domain-containing protein [Paenibacillus swuensis]
MELLWSDFLNSEWRDWRGSGQTEDRLDSGEWYVYMTKRWDLPPLGVERASKGAESAGAEKRESASDLPSETGTGSVIEAAAWAPRELPASAERDAMRAFRQRLLRMAQTLSEGRELTEADITALNAVMSAGPVTRRLLPAEAGGRSGLRLGHVPAGGGTAQWMAEVAASFAATAAIGDGTRVHFCDNADCRWVYYDDTRSRTKRYCEDRTCGNLMKVRRFRARQKLER